MPPRGKSTSLADIQPEMARIFDQVQTSSANHQKNCVALHKLHMAARQITMVKGGENLGKGLYTFDTEYTKTIQRAMSVKKGQGVADRTLKFAGAYMGHVMRKAEEEGLDEQEDSKNAYHNTLWSRVVRRTLLPAFQAKDKIPRYRAVQAMTEILSGLNEVQEDDYPEIRKALMQRTLDKEVMVRVQAVIGLSTILAPEDDEVEETDDGEPPQTILTRLLDRMNHDTSPEVRRAVMLNIPLTNITMDEVLRRTRDVDTTTRKMVYSHVLPTKIWQLDDDGEQVIGTSHPKVLKIEQRERVATNGLGDREASVKAAAAGLIGKWLDCLTPDDSPLYSGKKEEDDAPPKEEFSEPVIKLTALLSSFVLQEESKIARDVLLAMFDTRSTIFETLVFNESYWKNLNPETAFLVRVYVDHCIANKDQARLDDALPVVTALAFHIQEAWNILVESLQHDVRTEIDDSIDDAQFEKEFIIAEMFRIAVNLDYSDEIGLKKMHTLTHGMLQDDLLPQGLIPVCLDVLKKLSSSEPDFIRLIVPIIQDWRDPEGDTTPEPDPDDDDEDEDEGRPKRPAPRSSLFHKPIAELTPEEQEQSDEVDMHCLTLCIHMMERVMITLEQHSDMDGIVQGLIIPFVQRKEVIFRERGLQALGLVNLISRTMARQSLSLFVNQVAASPADLQCTLIKGIFDTVMIHHADFLENLENREWIRDYFLSLLTDVGSPLLPDVQALICLGLSKLCLSNMLAENDVLLMLWRAYLDPSTSGNLALRQNLAAFFSWYSHSSKTSQKHICDIFPHIFKAISEMRTEEREEGETELPTPVQIIGMFTEWTDPQHVKASGAREDVDEDLHIDFAMSIAKIILDGDDVYGEYLSAADKKALCQALNKLSLPDEVDDVKIRNLKVLANGLRTRKALDSVSKNAANKFDVTISKKYEDQLSEFTEEDWRTMEDLAESFKIIEMLGEDGRDDTPGPVAVPTKKGKKRRSDSMATDTESEVEGMGRTKSKRPRVSQSDDDDFEALDEPTPKPKKGVRLARKTVKKEETPPPMPKRARPKRSAAKEAEKKVEVINLISSEEEDEEEEEEEEEPEQEATPSPPPRRKGGRAKEVDEDEDMEDVEATPTARRRHSGPAAPQSEDEESEDEVNNLLADD